MDEGTPLIAGMAVGQVFLTFVGESAPVFGLICGVCVVGWAYGSLFWAMPTLIMELFGAKHFGVGSGAWHILLATSSDAFHTLVS